MAIAEAVDFFGKAWLVVCDDCFQLHFLEFECIEPGLRFGLLVGHQGVTATLASWSPCFITLTEESAMRLEMPQAPSSVTVHTQQGRGFLGNEDEEASKEPSQARSRTHSSSQMAFSSNP